MKHINNTFISLATNCGWKLLNFFLLAVSELIAGQYLSLVEYTFCRIIFQQALPVANI